MSKKQYTELGVMLVIGLIFLALIFAPVVLTNSTFSQRCMIEHHYDRNSIEWRMCVNRLHNGMAPEQVEREIREYQATRAS
jgi:hypothetical protein